jgi:uroporphyrinogen-III synthase
MERIVVTASEGSFSGLALALAERGVRLAERPLVSFAPPLDWTALDTALHQRGRYGSLALTSPRAAAAVADRLQALAISWDEGVGPRVWAIGTATAAALPGVPVAVPASLQDASSEGGASALAREMLAAGASDPVLFPCGDRRRDELPMILRGSALSVDEVVCYRTILATPEQARAAVSDGTMVVVASPSVLQLLVDSCPPTRRPTLIAIGPTTAAAARVAGWPPAAVATTPSTQSLAAAITGQLAPR